LVPTKASPAPGDLVAQVGLGTLNDVAFSADGQFVFAAYTTGVAVYRAIDLAEAAFLPVPDGAQALGLFADGRQVAIGTLFGQVIIARFDPAGGISLLPQTLNARPQSPSFDEYSEQVWALAISPDGKTAGVVSGQQVQFWDIASGQVLLAEALSNTGNHSSEIHFSGNSRYAWVSSRPGMVDSVIDLAASRVALKVGWPGRFLGDGQFVTAQAGTYGTNKYYIKVMSLPDGSAVKEFTLDGSPTRLLFSPDGKRLAAVYRQGAGAGFEPQQNVSYVARGAASSAVATKKFEFVVTVVDTSSGEIIDLKTHYISIPATDNLLASDPHFAGGFYFSGNWLLAGDWARDPTHAESTYCVLYGDRLDSGEIKLPFPQAQSLVGPFACRFVVSADEQQVAFFNPSGLVLLRAGASQPLTHVDSHAAALTALAFSTDGSVLTAGRGDASAQLFRVADGLTLLHEQGLEQSPGSSFRAPGGITAIIYDAAAGGFRLISTSGIRHFLAASADKPATVVPIVKGGTPALYGLAISPDGGTLAIGGYENAVRLVTSVPGAVSKDTFLEDSSPVSAIQYAPVGQLLAAGTEKGAIRLWNAGGGTLERTLRGHSQWVSGLAFDASGQKLYSASEDGTARVWQVANGAEARVLELYSPATSMALDPQGVLWAIGTRAGMILFWNIETGQWAGHLRVGAMPILALAFSPDGAQLAVGAQSGQLQLWQVRNTGGPSAGQNVATFTAGGPQKETAGLEACHLSSSQAVAAQQNGAFVANSSARLDWDLDYRGDCSALDETSLSKLTDLPEIVTKFTLARFPSQGSPGAQRLHITAEVNIPEAAGDYDYSWQLQASNKTAVLSASFTVILPMRGLKLPAPLYFVSEDGALLRLEEDGVTQTPVIEAPVQCMDVSMDGEIAYLSNDSLQVADANGANRRILLPVGGCPAWSPNGTWIAFTLNGLKLLNVATGEVQTLDTDVNAFGYNSRYYHGVLGWSPVGDKLIATASGWEWTGNTVFDVPGGARLDLPGEPISWSRDGQFVYSARAELNEYSGEPASILRINSSSGEQETLLGNTEADSKGGFSPFETPDGRLMVFASEATREADPCGASDQGSTILYPARMSLGAPGQFSYDKRIAFARSQLRVALWWDDGRATLLGLGCRASLTYELVSPFGQTETALLPIRGSNLRWGR
jgi:WD40 repeat protein